MRITIALSAFWLLLTLSPGPALAAETPSPDAELSQRLESVFASVDGLEPVEVTVSAGVVTLSGELVSDRLRAQAETLARQFEGVIEVQNDLIVSTAVVDRLGPAWERFEERSMRVVYNIPLLLLGIAVLLVAWWFSRWLSQRPWISSRFGNNPFMGDILRQVIRAGFMVAAILFVLDLLELTALVGAVLGAAGVATLAIGFAFRDLIENYISSILLSLRQPFEPQDLVEVGDYTGFVSRLTSRATVLMTLEGNHVRIPNSTVYKATMTNYSRNPRRRFDFDVGVDVELELLPVQALAERVLAGVEGVLTDPGPFCLVTQLGDSSVILRVFGWVDQTTHEFGRVRSEAIRQVKEAFDDNGIVMPEPIYNIKMLDQQSDAKRQELPSSGQARVSSDRPEGAETRRREDVAEDVEREMRDGQNLLNEAARKE